MWSCSPASRAKRQTQWETFRLPGPSSIWPFFHLAFRSNDIDGDIAHVRALGCPITVEPKSVEVNGKTIWVGFFLGPDGEVLEFFQHQPGPNETQL